MRPGAGRGVGLTAPTSVAVRERVPVPSGVLSVLTAGEGPAAVLLHGIPTGAELWRGVATCLADAGFRALAPDLPGYGATRVTAAADYSLAGAAGLVAGWLRESRLAPAWVVGHDAGGAVAQILAVRAPDTVARLTLVNSVADGSWPAPRARLSTLAARAGLYRPAARVGLVPNAYMRREVARAFADPARADAADVTRVLWDTKVSDPAGRAAFERHLAALTPRDTAAVAPALARLRVPCQVVWGMVDPFQAWDGPGRRLVALLPSPAVHHLDDCGHFAPLECPDRLAEALLDPLSRR